MHQLTTTFERAGHIRVFDRSGDYIDLQKLRSTAGESLITISTTETKNGCVWLYSTELRTLATTLLQLANELEQRALPPPR
jgi:hypothetical protein